MKTKWIFSAVIFLASIVVVGLVVKNNFSEKTFPSYQELREIVASPSASKGEKPAPPRPSTINLKADSSSEAEALESKIEILDLKIQNLELKLEALQKKIQPQE